MTEEASDVRAEGAGADDQAGDGLAALTDEAHWDSYWQGLDTLPIEVKYDGPSSTGAILEVLDRFAGSPTRRSILEIGGAPGGFLVHLWRRFDHHVTVLDNSPVGVALTRRNFKLLEVPGNVMHRDLFQTEPAIPQFDVAYSLGLIEHFADTTSVVRAHLAYVKPGGRLIIGCPNFLGVNGAVLRRLSPAMLDWHNTDAMDLRSWPRFEEPLGLTVRLRTYIAGFQPGAFWRCEGQSPVHTAAARAFSELGKHWNGPVARSITKLNSRHWSYYAIGVYDKPLEARDSSRVLHPEIRLKSSGGT
jgi:SAM-dependent methyltransferase